MENLKIYAKLAQVSSSIGPLATKTMGRYQASGNKEVIEPVKTALDAAKVIVTPNMHNFKIEIVKTTESTAEEGGVSTTEEIEGYLITADVVYKVVDTESGEFIEIPWNVIGFDKQNPSQGFGSALTYCHKYFYREFLNLFSGSGDDEDDDAEDKPAGRGNSRSRR